MNRRFDVVVIGGGQAALATGFYLRRSGRSFVLLDDQEAPGGAWRATWPSLTLFSPAASSSLPGWMMPAGANRYPTRDEAIAYLAEYERRYALPVERPVRVLSTHAHEDLIRLETTSGNFLARDVISATGTLRAPVWPEIDGMDRYRGEMIHSSEYRGPEPFAGKRVLVVGGGNSGAQIFADLVGVSRVSWVTREPPMFLPDEVDGQYLFEQGTLRFKALQKGRTPEPARSLGDIVMVASVRAVRDAGLLVPLPIFSAMQEDGVTWADGSHEAIDAVVFATGFRASLGHLAPLISPEESAGGKIAVEGELATPHPHVWPVGYGEWTGFASSTLIGCGRGAKLVVDALSVERSERGKR